MRDKQAKRYLGSHTCTHNKTRRRETRKQRDAISYTKRAKQLDRERQSIQRKKRTLLKSDTR